MRVLTRYTYLRESEHEILTATSYPANTSKLTERSCRHTANMHDYEQVHIHQAVA